MSFPSSALLTSRPTPRSSCQGPLSNELDRFWRLLMRTHSTRITFGLYHLHTRGRPHAHARTNPRAPICTFIYGDRLIMQSRRSQHHSVTWTGLCARMQECLCAAVESGSCVARGLCVREGVTVTLLRELYCMTCHCAFVSLCLAPLMKHR